MVEQNKKKCLKCGHEWNIRTESPISCPRCKSYDWKKLNEEKSIKK